MNLTEQENKDIEELSNRLSKELIEIKKMSKLKVVIAYKSLPTRLPLLPTISLYLLMVNFNLTPFWFGVFWTIMAIVWIDAIISIFKQEQVEWVNNNGDTNTNS